MAHPVVYIETIKTYDIRVVKCLLDDGSHEYVASVNGKVVCEDCDDLEFTIQYARNSVAEIINMVEDAASVSATRINIMAFRKITAISNAETGRSAVVYFDTDWREYRTCFATCGNTPKLGQGSDNHTDDKEDAIDTANYWVNNRADALGNLA